METTLTGVIRAIFDEKNVASHFNTKEFILTTEPGDRFPQHLPIQFVNENCLLLNGFKVDDIVNVTVKIKGKQWNGPQGTKYFLTLEAKDICKIV